MANWGNSEVKEVLLPAEDKVSLRERWMPVEK